MLLKSEEIIKLYNYVFKDRASREEDTYLSRNRVGAITFTLHNIVSDEELALLCRYLKRGGDETKTAMRRSEIKRLMAEECGKTFKQLDALLIKAEGTIRKNVSIPLMVLYDEHQLAQMEETLAKKKPVKEVENMLKEISEVPYLWNFRVYANVSLDNINGGLSRKTKQILDSAGIFTVRDVLKLGDDFWEIPELTNFAGEEVLRKINALKPPYLFAPEKLMS